MSTGTQTGPRHKVVFRRLPELPAGLLHGGAVLHRRLFLRRPPIDRKGFSTIRRVTGFMQAWPADLALHARDRSADAIFPVLDLGHRRFRAINGCFICEDGEWLSETGPMWFCAALLLFSIIYGLIRLTGWSERNGRSVATALAAALSGFIAAMATIDLRRSHRGPRRMPPCSTFIPAISRNMFSCSPPAPSAIAALGCPALPERVLHPLGTARAVRLSVAAVCRPDLLFGGGLHGDTALYAGGFNLGQCREMPVGGAGLRRRWVS